MDLQQFLQSSASAVVEERVHKVYDILEEGLGSLMSVLQSNREHVKQAVTAVQDELKSYTEKHQIDAQFIRSVTFLILKW